MEIKDGEKAATRRHTSRGGLGLTRTYLVVGFVRLRLTRHLRPRAPPKEAWLYPGLAQ